MTPHPPFWTLPLLLALVALGWRLSRPRAVHAVVPLAVAVVMAGWSLRGVGVTFGLDPLALLAWAVGAGAVLGHRAPREAARALQVRDDGRVWVPGSWLPMAALLAIFATQAALGTAQAIGAAVLHEPAFLVAACAVLGGASGSFLARGWAVHRCARRHRRAGQAVAAGAASVR